MATLASRLSLLLPKDLRFHVHHVVGQPTTCESLFAPAPAATPDETLQESHTLSVSINHEGALLHVFALEAIFYETASLTTLFVSKADSTGYGYLQEKRYSSSTKTIVVEFLSYLVDTRRREGIKFVISLFARAQDQYLFPGSIENTRKHVLDDRQLIKWWCKILDRVLRRYGLPSTSVLDQRNSATISQGLLQVPGCDSREVRLFFPREDSGAGKSMWLHGDPLKSLQSIPDLPERCLIPRFPDDPKSRFAIDLDDELPENQLTNGDDGEEERKESPEDGNLPIPKNPPTAEYSPSSQPDPPKPRSDGKWRSVRSLDQFWELMGFRQECAAGRLVGFIWGVIDSLPSPPTNNPSEPDLPLASNDTGAITSGEPPNNLTLDGLASPPNSSQLQPESDNTGLRYSLKKPPTVIKESEPSLITPSSSQIAQVPLQVPESQIKPMLSRNDELLLLSPAYDALSNVLQTGDYSTLALAKVNTARWVDALEKEIRISGGEEAVERSRDAVIGLEETLADDVDEKGKTENGVHVEGAGAKRQREDEGDVKVLAEGLVRKKRKA